MAVNVSLVRDTKWLTLEVCREFQRGTCSRSDAECKFAHPSRSCHVENGRVIACFDSLKVRTVTRALPQLPCFSFPSEWLGAQGWDVQNSCLLLCVCREDAAPAIQAHSDIGCNCLECQALQGERISSRAFFSGSSGLTQLSLKQRTQVVGSKWN